MSDTYDEVLEAEKVKTMAATDRKCPACGGVMDFDPSTGGLHCPFCDHTETIAVANETGAEKAEELDFESAEFTGNCDWGAEKKTVTCKACGAVSVYDALEVSSECPYCGSNQVMEASDVKTLAPNGVVPFKITVEDAAKRFVNWLGKKWFCPSAAKRSAKADAFTGIYLPYWTFDTNTSSTYTAEYGIDRKVKKGDKEETVTDWHKTNGSYSKFIDDELVCGTNAHETGILNMIEPYDTNDNKAYKPEYLAGFGAERYSIGLKDAWEKAKQFIKSKLNGAITSKIMQQYNADHVRNLQVNTNFADVTYKYLMLPVWISSFTFSGKIYQFMVNGQSGKVGGKYPVSPWRVLVAILIVVVVIGLIMYFSRG